MEWIKFSEQRPQQDTRLLVWDTWFNEARVLWWNSYHNCWDDEYGDDIEVSIDTHPNRITHWMELPKIPDSLCKKN